MEEARKLLGEKEFQIDILRKKTSWSYLLAVIDAFDKEIVGYKFSRFCRTDELLFAVNQAIRTRFPNGVKDQGLTIRSDNGCQMTSPLHESVKRCRCIYRKVFSNLIKEGTVWLQEYVSFAEAQKDINQYIYFYNTDRPHLAIGYLSPKEFKEALSLKAV